MGKSEKQDLLQEAIEQIPINKFQLDEECEKNGSLYRYWSDILADLKASRDLLKIELKEKEAEVNIKTKKGDVPSEYIGIKLTDPVCESIVKVNPDVKDVNRKLVDMERQVNKLEAVVKVFGQRKGLLDDLVTLFVSNYWSEPDTTKRKSVNNDITDNINNNLKNRRKRRNGNKEE